MWPARRSEESLGGMRVEVEVRTKHETTVHMAQIRLASREGGMKQSWPQMGPFGAVGQTYLTVKRVCVIGKQPSNLENLQDEM